MTSEVVMEVDMLLHNSSNKQPAAFAAQLFFHCFLYLHILQLVLFCNYCKKPKRNLISIFFCCEKVAGRFVVLIANYS